MKVSRREIILYFVILFLLVVLGGGHVKNYYDAVVGDSRSESSGFIVPRESLSEQDVVSSSLDESQKSVKIMVHISGAVVNPGVVTVNSGTRVKDVIDLAGGVYDTADLDRINLAKIVYDEQKIYVPSKGEDTFVLEAEHASISSLDVPGGNSSSSGKVNINQCSKSELISLPGIGEKTAEKIMEYRKEHGFQRIEDIMKVKGIGEKKFEAIKDLICIH